MRWIAKNSITGKEYGKTYNSIYDCQKYIDTELIILQYEWKRIQVLEEKTINQEKREKWIKEKYPNGLNIAMEIYANIEYAVHTLGQETQDGQNVIRCYSKTQKRYATGFDY